MLWKHKERLTAPNNAIRVCPRCLSVYPEDTIFCSKDGSKLLLEMDMNVGESKCIQCGAYLPADETECPECGYSADHSNPVLRLTPLLSSSIVIWKFPYEFGREDIIRIEGAEYVNSRHLMFYLSNKKIVARELKTLNGTKINGKILGRMNQKKEVELKSGDILELAINSQGEGMVKLSVNVVDASGI